MPKPILHPDSRSKAANTLENKTPASRRRQKGRRLSENNDVLVSAVISSCLLSHLHHVLQRAEFGASQEGRRAHAKNFAQLRKVLCMDARSMADASAKGLNEAEIDQLITPQIRPDAA